MKHINIIRNAVAVCLLAISCQLANAKQGEEGAKVQVAILLDTSSSMSGLIEQAKTQLWKIVNTFVDARKGESIPFVEVALYEYGNSSLKESDSWIRQLSPLSRDLDVMSEHLFSLQTRGGNEFCGVVIDQAVKQLKWDQSEDVYKVIFVAGNEPFTQGPLNPVSVCKDAFSQGIIVNSIHCGDAQTGISGGWRSGPELAGGSYLVINQNKSVVHIDAPQDQQITDLSNQLNQTYVSYGKSGNTGKENQLRQDDNAMVKKESGAQVQRAVSKASKNYNNVAWDLVDASRDTKFDWEGLSKEELPEAMQKMNLEERKAYIEEQSEKREDLKLKILKLNNERESYVTEKRKENKSGLSDTLDEVMKSTVKEQAKLKGYTFKE